MASRIFPRLRVRAVALLAVLLPLCAARAEPKVRGTLSSSSASVGEVLELQVVVTGEKRGARPEAPRVDGLEISRMDAGERSTMMFGGNDPNMRFEQTFSFRLVPRREGKFTIPPIEVRVGESVVKTLPVTLTVTPDESMEAAGDFAFAKTLLEKKTTYLGETVPLEFRLYLDASANWSPNFNSPVLNGDGFTTQPLKNPTVRDVERAGKTYHLVSFRTLITPGKAGKFAIGPVPVSLVFEKLSKTQPQYRLLGPRFDPPQEMKVEAPIVEVQVKPLPGEGRPKDFSGAIGKFEFEATGTPGSVKIGEPVSMKLTIKGRGNFDRIDQPALADPNGWTTYSAKQQFEPGDNFGAEGVKTFEVPVTPTERKSTMPVFAFSFFDPDAGKYVTLMSAAAHLKVEGEPAPLRIASSPQENTGTKPEQPKVEPKAPAVRDILPNLPQPGTAAGFGLRTSPLVLFSAMFAPLPVMLALLAWRSRKADARAQRAAALRREKSDLLVRVRKSSDRAEVVDAAVRVLQIDSAIETGQPAEAGELAQVLVARKLDDSAERAVRELFDARNELLYAGGSRGADRLGENERDRLLDTLATYERSAMK